MEGAGTLNMPAGNQVEDTLKTNEVPTPEQFAALKATVPAFIFCPRPIFFPLGSLLARHKETEKTNGFLAIWEETAK